jgi:hypothetical protein
MTLRNRRSGQALAEFALVLPVLLVLLLGVFDFGRAIIVNTGLTNAAREGARLAIVNQDIAMIRQRALEQSVMTAPTITVQFFIPPAVPSATPSVTCGSFTSGGVVVDPPSEGCLAVVEITAQFRAITPLIGDLIGPISLAARSTATVEFSCPRPDVSGHPFGSASSCPKQP